MTLSRRRRRASRFVHAFAVAAACAAARATADPAATQDAPATTPATMPATAPATVPADDLEPILSALDDDDYARREAAEAELVERLIARPALRAAVERAGEADWRPEVRARCRSALGSYEEFRLFGETRVSLSLRDAGDRALVDAFAEAAGVRFGYWPENLMDADANNGVNGVNGANGGGAGAEGASLDLDAAGFFPALAELCRATGLSAMVSSPRGDDGGDIYLTNNGGGGGGYFDLGVPTDVAGAFAVQLVSLSRSRTDTAVLARDAAGAIRADQNSNDQLYVSMRVLCEPKIRLASGLGSPQIDEATDDLGHNLLNDVSRQYSGYYGGGRGGWSHDVRFALDPSELGAATSIAALRGKLEAEVAVETVTLDAAFDELPVVADADENNRAGQPGQAGQAEPAGKQYVLGPYRLHLAVVRPPEKPEGQDQEPAGRAAKPLTLAVVLTGGPEGAAGDAADNGASAARRRNAVLNALQVLDAAGNPYAYAGGGGSGWDGNTLRLTRYFRPQQEDAAPARVRWELPARVRVLTVPFEFHDVPLPTGN